MSPPLHFCFLDNRPAYDAGKLATEPMGGVKKGTILLGEALARRGHQVSIHNRRDHSESFNGVSYYSIKDPHITSGSIVISNNQIPLFDLAADHVKVLWSRNNITLGRVRKQQSLRRLFKQKPHIVFPGTHAASQCPWYLPFRTRTIIPHGVDPCFMPAPKEEAPSPVAVFASQPRRNLAHVIKAWEAIVHPQLPEARLLICHPKDHRCPEGIEDKKSLGIEVMGSLPKDELQSLFARARVLIYPGHRTETFCNVAAEALITGLPISTMGIGSLKERVQDGRNGLIAQNISQMGGNTLRMLEDDTLWLQLHRHAIESSEGSSWDVRAEEWERAAGAWLQEAK